MPLQLYQSSLCGSLPRDDLRMQKYRKSDISFDLEKRVHLLRSCTKINLADEMHASLTDNLSFQTVQTLIRIAKCWLSSKSKLFDILMALDGTLSLDWPQS